MTGEAGWYCQTAVKSHCEGRRSAASVIKGLALALGTRFAGRDVNSARCRDVSPVYIIYTPYI